MQELIRTLPQRAGTGSVQGNLEEVARAALTSYLDGVSMPAAATPSRTSPAARQGGPRAANATGRPGSTERACAALVAYLRGEQRLGRVQLGCDPEPVAALLFSACERRALHLRVMGKDALGSTAGFAAELARTLTHTLTA